MNRIKFFHGIKEEYWAIFILLSSFIYFFTIILMSKGLYGDIDSISHYQLAQFAYKYPANLVKHWGKPLYTTLCAPFAQFGFTSALVFNVICGLLASWLTYLIAKELKYKNSLLAIPFALFAPIYMVTMMTCLTEILFSLVLVAAIYFFLKQKSILSAVIISCIPFARTEGLMFFPLFILVFLLKKHYKAIPFLATGFIVFSLAGYLHYKDLLWFFNAMPYSEKGSELYGSGSFFYYFKNFENIAGWPLTILAVSGILLLAIGLFRSNKPGLSYQWITQNLLITGSFLIFLLVHSFLWWKGLMGVLASYRFMACIMPLMGILALSGLNFYLSFLKENTWIKNTILAAVTAFILITPYLVQEIPAKLTEANQVMKRTADALKNMGYTDHKLVYFDPRLCFYLNDDPNDQERFKFWITDPQKPERGVPDSALLVWDPHGGGLEKQIFLEDMLANPNFRLIDGFVPDKDYRFGKTGMNYMSLIFRKVPPEFPLDKWKKIDSLDFETAAKEKQQKFLTDSISFSGKRSNVLSSESSYSISASVKFEDIPLIDKMIFRSRVKVLIPDKSNADKLLLIVEVRDGSDKMYRYIVIHASYFKPKPGEWTEIYLLSPVQTDFPPGGYIKTYLYNTGNQTYYADDHVLEYLPVTE